MAITELLATGTTAANSSDLVVAANTPVTVCLKDAAGPGVGNGARVDIQLKADSGEYFAVGSLTGARPAVSITAAGTYRLSRAAGVSCGVFSA
jgi:hypothetical protein